VIKKNKEKAKPPTCAWSPALAQGAAQRATALCRNPMLFFPLKNKTPSKMSSYRCGVKAFWLLLMQALLGTGWALMHGSF